MAGDTKDVELRIRAILDGKKSLTETVEALKDLAKAQDDQLASAKKGEVSAKALQKSYEDLAKVAESLVSKAALTRDFETQAQVLAEVKTRVEAARQAQAAFAQSIANTNNLSNSQTEQQRKLARAVTSAETAQTRAENRLAGITQKLADYGIAANNVSAAQTEIRQALTQTEQALQRQSAALKTVDADMARAKAEAAAFAKAEKESADAWDAALAKTAQWERSMADFQAAMRAQKEKELASTREQIEAENRYRDALRQSADAAAARARGATTLARPQTAAPQSNLAGAIQATVNPQSVTTLNSVEAAVAAIEKRAATAVGPVRGYAQAMREAEDAQRRLVTVARQIDAFQNQITALRQTRAEYVQARDAVASLVAQMRAGTGGASLSNDLTSAQAKLRAAAEAMAAQTERARSMREQLRAAGVSTNDLSATQDRLTQQAARSVAATETLTGAVQKYGTSIHEARRAGESYLGFATRITGERTTLSYFQRLRGEILGLATAYIGINAAVDLAKGAIQVALDNQRIMNGLTAVFAGDTARARTEFEYLRQITLKLGVNFDTAAKGYAKFAIGAKTAGFTINEIRFTFERLSLAARNAGLSNEEYEGTLKAVEQMMSKGVIQAEELKGQLGDRLPGAVSLLAQSMGKTVPDLLKLMEKGGIEARNVLNLAREAGKTFGTTFESSASRLQAAIAAQENVTRNFKEALGNAGFVEDYTAFLNKLSSVLNSPQGKQFAQDLSKLFSAVLKVLTIVVENLDLVKVGLDALVIVGAVAWANKLVLAFQALRVSMAGLGIQAVTTSLSGAVASMSAAFATAGTLTGAIGLLSAAFKILGRSIPIVGALLIAYDIGKALYDRFKGDADRIRDEAGTLQKEVTAKMNPLGESSFFGKTSKGLTPEDGIGFVSADQQAAKSIEEELKKNQKKLDTRDKASRATGAKAELEQRIAIATEEQRALRERAEQEIKDETLRAKTIAAIDKQINFIRITETRNFNREQDKAGETAAAKRLRLAMDLAQQLDNLANKNADKEAQIDPNATFEQRLEARKKVAADAYDEVAKKIRALDDLLAKDPKATAAVNARLKEMGIEGGLPGAKAALDRQRNAAVDTAAKEATQKEVDRLEKKLSEQQGLLAAKLEAEQKVYESGAQTQQQLLDNRARLTADYNKQIDESAVALETFATKYKGLLDPAQYDTLISRITGIRAGLNANRTDLEARLTAQEATTNRVLDERKRLLDEIKTQQDAGLITSEEAARRTNEVNDSYRARIDANAAATIALVDALKQLNLPPEVIASLDSIASKMRNVRAENSNMQRAFSDFEKSVQGAVAGGIGNGIGSMVDGVAKVAFGIDKSRSSWVAFRDEGRKAIASILSDIAQLIIKLQIANALAASTNPSVQQIGVLMGGTKPTAAAAGAAGAAGAAPAGQALTDAAATAAATQTAAATAAATTTTGAAAAAAATTEGAAVAAQVIDQTTTTATTAEETVAASTAASQIAAAGSYFAGVVEAAAAGQAAASAFHTGGVIGGAAKMSRTVSPMVFANAQRFHKGGVPGLSRDEVPAVLQKGEEVLTRNDPRHVLNGGKSGAPSAAPAGQRFVLVDDRTKVAEAMATSDGEQVTMMHLRRNIASIKALLR